METLPLLIHGAGKADDFVTATAPFDGASMARVPVAGADHVELALGTARSLYQDRDAWRQLVHNAMSRDYSWDRQGAHYVELYRRLTGAPETQAATRG